MEDTPSFEPLRAMYCHGGGRDQGAKEQKASTRQWSSLGQTTSNRGSRRAPAGTLALQRRGAATTTQQHMPMSPPITAALPRHKDQPRKGGFEQKKGLRIEAAKGPMRDATAAMGVM